MIKKSVMNICNDCYYNFRDDMNAVMAYREISFKTSPQVYMQSSYG